MKKSEIIIKNQGFYCDAIGFVEMIKPLFAEAVIRSLAEPIQYGVELGNYSGYILIDGSKIGMVRRNDFINDVHCGILNRVLMEIPSLISGELAEDAVVVIGIYKFEFHISKYERDSKHKFEPVCNLFKIPSEEEVGHFVDLKITVTDDE